MKEEPVDWRDPNYMEKVNAYVNETGIDPRTKKPATDDVKFVAEHYGAIKAIPDTIGTATSIYSAYIGYNQYYDKPYVDIPKVIGKGVEWSKAKVPVGSSQAGVGAKNNYINPELVDELAKQNVKYNPDEMIIIGKDSSGKILWLETGNEKAGFEHIIIEHGEQFVKQGISIDSIPDYLMSALKKGEIVGYQGRGTGRPIYEIEYNGKRSRVAITAGNNGFIVGANPSSLP